MTEIEKKRLWIGFIKISLVTGLYLAILYVSIEGAIENKNFYLLLPAIGVSIYLLIRFWMIRKKLRQRKANRLQQEPQEEIT